jgi:hypothetical protein
MTAVRYTGAADIRSFTKDDFALAGVEFKKIDFHRNVVTEVPEDVARLLIEQPIYGDFDYVSPDDVDEKETRLVEVKESDRVKFEEPAGSQQLTEDSPKTQHETGTSKVAAKKS